MQFPQAEQVFSEIAQRCWPVDCLFHSVSPVSPTIQLGFGTWVAYGTGRMLVGIDAGQTEFNTVGNTGGEKTHTLTTGEMPIHTHIQDPHTHVQDPHNHTQNAHNHTQAVNSATTGALSGYTPDTSTSTSATSGYSTGSTTATNQPATATNQNTTATNQNTGGGGPHNNLPPYIVVYIWRRTA